MTTHKDTTMLEKCARAACQAGGINPSPEQIKVAAVFTRAILNELKQPSEGMIAAAMKCADVDFASEFTAAIDYVLNEGEGK